MINNRLFERYNGRRIDSQLRKQHNDKKQKNNSLQRNKVIIIVKPRKHADLLE